MIRAILIALLLAAAPAGAASPSDVRPDSTRPPPTSLVRALDRIRPASSVRVDASTHVLLEGTLDRWDVQSLSLRTPAGATEILLSTLQGLWVRGLATGHGAKVGAIALGILGAIAGPVTVGLDRVREGGSQEAPQAGDFLGAAAIGAAAGVAIGALVGAGVGAACSRWNRRYP